MQPQTYGANNNTKR